MATLPPALSGLIEAQGLEVPVGGAFRADQVVETYGPMAAKMAGEVKIVALP